MNSLRKAFYHLQTAKEYFDDTIRQAPGSVAADRSKLYSQRLQWIKKDFASDPRLPSGIAAEFRSEINGDTLFPAAIAEKVLMLPVDAREDFEKVLDLILSGENITISHQ